MKRKEIHYVTIEVALYENLIEWDDKEQVEWLSERLIRGTLHDSDNEEVGEVTGLDFRKITEEEP